MICRTCRSANLTEFLDLGFTPPADQFLRREQLREPEVYYPLQVMICGDCGLAQLSYVVSPEILYRHDYPYESSITKTGRLHWSEFAKSVVEWLRLGHDDLVVDIGSNVGVLLQAFNSQGVQTLGVEPASNIARLAERQGVETVNEFFSIDVARSIREQFRPASVITATNVFAHIDDLDGMMEAVKLLLNEKGVFIIEAPYFLNLIDRLEYDTIYHEHLSYLSVKPLVRFFGRHRMEVFQIEERDIHGGSFRVYVTHAGRMPVSPVVGQFLNREEQTGIHSLATLTEFAGKVQQNRQDLLWQLRKLKHDGKRIAAASAPAKGMTLLNYCRLGPETLDFVTEKSTLKIGRLTPGTHVPVFPDDELIKRMPDYALLLAWNFADEIMKNLSEYTEKGGKFILPIPHPQILG